MVGNFVVRFDPINLYTAALSWVTGHHVYSYSCAHINARAGGIIASTIKAPSADWKMYNSRRSFACACARGTIRLRPTPRLLTFALSYLIYCLRLHLCRRSRCGAFGCVIAFAREYAHDRDAPPRVGLEIISGNRTETSTWLIQINIVRGRGDARDRGRYLCHTMKFNGEMNRWK